jgi:hypothetical protein
MAATTVGRIPATVSISVGYNGGEPIVIATGTFDIVVNAEFGDAAAGSIEDVSVTSKPPTPTVRSEIADALRKIADEIDPPRLTIAEVLGEPALEPTATWGRLHVIPEQPIERIQVLALPTEKVANAERTPFLLIIDRVHPEVLPDVSWSEEMKRLTGASAVIVSPRAIEVAPGFEVTGDIAAEILERIGSVKSEAIAPIVERVGRTVTEASVVASGEWFEPADIRPLLESAAADVRLLASMADVTVNFPTFTD